MGANRRGVLVKCEDCDGMYRSKNIEIHLKSRIHKKKSLNNKWNKFFMQDSQNNHNDKKQ
jgi:hypothetical protein